MKNHGPLVGLIVLGLEAMVFDIETAFLMGDLDKKIYMKCPEGMIHEENEHLLLMKTIYGLVQASRIYYKKYAGMMKDLGFERCKSDPCLFMKNDHNGLCYILTYVDDNLVVGTRKALDQLLIDLKKTEFTFTVEHNLTDYLSCEIIREGNKAWLGQPHI